VARKLRIQYPAAIYHVMNRGDRREPIFCGDHDRQMFLDTLGQACEKTDWLVHAWCLMNNHFHLVLETPRPNLVDGMKWFLGTYTSRFNRRHKYFGHLFSGRYKALIVDGSTTGYLKSVCDYVHLNPARAKLLGPADSLTVFRWSSFNEYLKPPRQRPSWLRVERLLGEWGIPKDSPAGREHFQRMTETRRMSEDQQLVRKIERGWCYGSEEFRQELLAQMETSFGRHHAGSEKQESAQAKAERIVTEELQRRKIALEELEQLKKANPLKLKIALRLRQETTMTWDWIAHHLFMGVGAYAANSVRAEQNDGQHSKMRD
jgi:REP element-mobilizing transposase RayT